MKLSSVHQQHSTPALSLQDLQFERPASLQATRPPEYRGKQRDEVRLLVSTPAGHTHTVFHDIPRYFQAGDVLVVNDSATLAASLSAGFKQQPCLLNLSTQYAPDVWLVEPRYAHDKPGPLPVHPGDSFTIGDSTATLIAPHPTSNRLYFARFSTDVTRLIHQHGSPIHYGYVTTHYPLELYQTVFARVPGSAEMPSAARPFSQRVIQTLKQKGVRICPLTLHTGVSSIELTSEDLSGSHLLAEPFYVPANTAACINSAKRQNKRVIAAGTTVIRALESAWDGCGVRSLRGVSRKFVRPGVVSGVADGLLTGFHDPGASHLAMLFALAGEALVMSGYQEAVAHAYLWHEFGDSQLLLWA